jgi:hypothetical protein
VNKPPISDRAAKKTDKPAPQTAPSKQRPAQAKKVPKPKPTSVPDRGTVPFQGAIGRNF